MARPSPAPPARPPVMKGRKMLVGHLLRHAGAVVGDVDQQVGAVGARPHGHGGGAGLEGVAAEIDEDAVEQVAVGARLLLVRRPR